MAQHNESFDAAAYEVEAHLRELRRLMGESLFLSDAQGELAGTLILTLRRIEALAAALRHSLLTGNDPVFVSVAQIEIDKKAEAAIKAMEERLGLAGSYESTTAPDSSRITESIWEHSDRIYRTLNSGTDALRGAKNPSSDPRENSSLKSYVLPFDTDLIQRFLDLTPHQRPGINDADSPPINRIRFYTATDAEGHAYFIGDDRADEARLDNPDDRASRATLKDTLIRVQEWDTVAERDAYLAEIGTRIAQMMKQFREQKKSGDDEETPG